MSNPTTESIAKLDGIVQEHFLSKGRRLYHPILIDGYQQESMIVDKAGFMAKWEAIRDNLLRSLLHDLQVIVQPRISHRSFAILRKALSRRLQALLNCRRKPA